jgi:uncharacterized protein YukE
MNGYFEIDSAAIGAAAGKYTTEAGKFEGLLTEIMREFDEVMAAWDDASKAEWQARVTSAKNSLTNVADILSKNGKVLGEISALAQAAENRVKAGIASM